MCAVESKPQMCERHAKYVQEEARQGCKYEYACKINVWANNPKYHKAE